MSSTFGAYSIAYSGMYVNQASLAATSTNLANVDTTGASRVRVASSEEATTSAGTSTGSGVSVASITRARDKYLDATYRTQNADAAYLSVKSGNLEYIDEILTEYQTSSSSDDESGTAGVQQAIDDFFDSWETLSTDTSTESTRQAVTAAGTDLISILTDIDTELQQLQADAVTVVKDGVDSLNDLASQVADLNDQITKAEANGSEASYLRDQRDVLLDEMSSLADISTSESGGTFQVTLGGTSLVYGGEVHTLAVSGTGGTNDPLAVEWTDLNTTANISSGSIGAYLEDADQSGYEVIDTTTLPYDWSDTATSSISTMRQSLNDLITTLATQINSLSTSGVDLNGDAGLAFFTVIDSTQPLSITNIQVNSELLDDTDKIVAGTSDADGDNTIADEICSLATDTTCYQSSGLALDITGFYEAVTSWIGTAGSDATSSYETQTTLVTQVDAQRQSISSISIDDEMANMIAFQNAYAASARVLSTLDTLVAGLIQDLG